MIVDRDYCISSFLMYRFVIDGEHSFSSVLQPRLWDEASNARTKVSTSEELEEHIRQSVEDACRNGNVALALSGGIDSAILARFMPKGSVAYTFKCVVPGVQVTDETPQAAIYAEENGLEHRIVEITWEDYEELAPVLMRHKGAPIHSIEVQIYKAAMRAKEDGFDALIFGENADVTFGGMNGLLEKDWLFGEFVERYSHVLPYRAVKNPLMLLEPFRKYESDGHVEPHDFINDYFTRESIGSYDNACNAAGVKFVGPFTTALLGVPIDYDRIRSGDTKYLVREVFKHLYPDLEAPAKIPMPRPMGEWLGAWEGPTRDEFWPHCTDEMSGDQRWIIWATERFLNLLDEIEQG